MFNLKKFVQGPDLNDEIQTYSYSTNTKPSSSSVSNSNGVEVRKIYEQIIQEPSSSRNTNNSQNPSSSKAKSKPLKRRIIIGKKSIHDIMQMCETNSIDELEDYIGTFGPDSVTHIRDQWDWTPLMTAGASGSVDVLKLLLSNGADWKITDKSGQTVIDLARKNKQLEVCTIIEEWERINQVKPEVEDDDDDCVILEPSDFQQVPKYCEICQTNYCNDQRKHDNSIAHLVSNGPGSLDDKVHYGIPESNIGFQLMLRSGWSRKGLGPASDGQKFPVKTVLKRDRKGLGDKSNLQAKITHFGPFDTDAVQGTRPRIERASTVKKKEHQHNQNREKRKEIHLRRELNGI